VDFGILQIEAHQQIRANNQRKISMRKRIALLLLIATSLSLAGGQLANAADQQPAGKQPAVATSPCDTIHAEYSSVLKVGSLYWMYYSGIGSSCNWSLHYATSPDGKRFDKQGQIVLLDGWSDQQAFPFVLYEGGRFRMWYGGGVPYRIGYAESSDGIHFTAQPRPVLELGSEPGWENSQLVRPSVLHQTNPQSALLQDLSLPLTTTNLYLMYYNGFGTGQPPDPRRKRLRGQPL